MLVTMRKVSGCLEKMKVGQTGQRLVCLWARVFGSHDFDELASQEAEKESAASQDYRGDKKRTFITLAGLKKCL
jgi:hypothetical protein